MKARAVRDVNVIAAACGADGWTLVRECRHLLIEFRFGDRAVRQVMANTASDRRARANVESELRRAVRAGAAIGDRQNSLSEVKVSAEEGTDYLLVGRIGD